MSEDWPDRGHVEAPPRPRIGWRELSSPAKIGYTSATMLTALAVAISLVAYGLYLRLDRTSTWPTSGG